MRLLIFARADHPEGWGFGKTAHGYVTIGILCSDEQEVNVVKEHVASHGIKLWGDHWDEWYGGTFDFLASFDVDEASYQAQHGVENRECSYGDNRYWGLYRAEQLLSARHSE